MATKSEKSVKKQVLTAPTPRRQLFRALEAKSLRNRSFLTRVADYLTSLCSTPVFLFLNILFFAIWIILNIGIIPGIIPFDSFPFGLLTMAVSLEAIVLSIFVLVSQNRAAQIATLRDELNLRVNLIAEEEITKILEILVDMRKKMNITSQDLELETMLQDTNANDLEMSILQQIERADQLITRRHLRKSDFPNLIATLVKPKK